MNKLDFIDEYIKRCDEILTANNYSAAKDIQTEIISTFENEIPSIRGELDNYSMAGVYQNNRTVDFLGDLKLLKKKLENYYFNIQEEDKRREYSLELARLSQPVVTASAESNPVVYNTIQVSLTNVMEQLDKMATEEISDGDKNAIKELLYSLEGIKSTKDKHKFWEKAKCVLVKILDKGIDVGIAILPYITNGLQ